MKNIYEELVNLIDYKINENNRKAKIMSKNLEKKSFAFMAINVSYKTKNLELLEIKQIITIVDTTLRKASVVEVFEKGEDGDLKVRFVISKTNKKAVCLQHMPLPKSHKQLYLSLVEELHQLQQKAS